MVQEIVLFFRVREEFSEKKYLASAGGSGSVTGQRTQTVAMEEIDEIRKITGRKPALRGYRVAACKESEYP